MNPLKLRVLAQFREYEKKDKRRQWEINFFRQRQKAKKKKRHYA
jgi:hypothetical protein